MKLLTFINIKRFKILLSCLLILQILVSFIPISIYADEEIVTNQASSKINSFLETMPSNETLKTKIKGGKVLKFGKQADEPIKENPVIDNKFKRHWSDSEIIALGYIPGEVVVKFKENKINLQNAEGKQKLQSVIQNTASQVGNTVIQSLKLQETPIKMELNALSEDNISLLADNFISLEENLEFANISVFSLAIDEAVKETVLALKDNPEIENVSPNYVFTFDAVPPPNDTEFGNLWGLNNTGQKLTQGISVDELSCDGSDPCASNNPDPSGKNPDIEILSAWDKSTGNKDMIVAVLDTGVAYNHPDLKANMWNGSICYDINNNLISGGCPNHGYDFANADNDPNDDEGHGTHIAGTIGAVANNNKGVTGINWNIQIMAVKIGKAYAGMTEVIKGLQFAKNNGVKIVNASFGEIYKTKKDYGLERFIEIENFTNQNGLFIAGAGNDKNDNDVNTFYPASSDLEGIISVAATDQADNWANWSNVTGSHWGKNSVDVYAPGTNILSTYIDIY